MAGVMSLPSFERRALTKSLANKIGMLSYLSPVACGALAHAAMKLVEHPADFFRPEKVRNKCDTFSYELASFFNQTNVWGEWIGNRRVKAWDVRVMDISQEIPWVYRGHPGAVDHHVAGIKDETGEVVYADFSSAQFDEKFSGPTIAQRTHAWWEDAEPLFESYGEWRRYAGLEEA